MNRRALITWRRLAAAVAAMAVLTTTGVVAIAVLTVPDLVPAWAAVAGTLVCTVAAGAVSIGGLVWRRDTPYRPQSVSRDVRPPVGRYPVASVDPVPVSSRAARVHAAAGRATTS